MPAFRGATALQRTVWTTSATWWTTLRLLIVGFRVCYSQHCRLLVGWLLVNFHRSRGFQSTSFAVVFETCTDVLETGEDIHIEFIVATLTTILTRNRCMIITITALCVMTKRSRILSNFHNKKNICPLFSQRRRHPVLGGAVAGA